jgi:hypothetical protein
MANQDAPFGFRPVAKTGSSPDSSGYSEYGISSGYATAIYEGDAVKMTASGVVALAAAGDRLLGVAGGVSYTDPTTEQPTYSNKYPGGVAASDIKIQVYDDPNQLFLVQSAGTVATTNIGNNADLSYTTGNSKSGVSKAELSGTMAATGAQFRIVRVSNDPENSTTGSANANVIVRIDEHFYGTETGV